MEILQCKVRILEFHFLETLLSSSLKILYGCNSWRKRR